MREGLRRNVKDLWAMLALALLAGLFYLPWLLQGQSLNQGDFPILGGPVFHWLHNRYAQGGEALWIQGIACGEPIADAQGAFAYYPFTRSLLTLFSGASAYVLHLALHTGLLALGCYALARSYGRSRQGAFLGALCAGFGGAFTYSYNWPTVLVTMAWLPWALLGLRQTQQAGRRLRGAALLGLAMGMGFNGGYPGMVIYALAPLAAVQLHWMLTDGRDARQVWGALLLATTLALLIAAPPLMDIARLAAQSRRGEKLSLQEAASNPLSPAALAQLVAPHALGREADETFLGASWRFGSYTPQGLVLYIGVAGLFLALAGLGGPGQLPLLASLAVLLCYALGAWTPLHAWVTRLPGFDHLRGPLKAILFVGTLGCLCVAQGYDRLSMGVKRRGLWAFATAVTIGLLALAGALWWAQAPLLARGNAYIQAAVLHSPIHHRGAGFYAAKFLRYLQGLRLHLLFQGALAFLSLLLLSRLAWLPRRFAFAAIAVLLLGDLWVNDRAGAPLISHAAQVQTDGNLQWLMDRQADDGPWRMMVWGRRDHLLRVLAEPSLSPAQRERELLQLPMGDQALYHGLDQFNGYSVADTSRGQPIGTWQKDDRADADMDALTAELIRHRPLLDLGAVRYIISSAPLTAPGLRRVKDGPDAIYANADAAPMAYLASTVRRAPDATSALQALLAPGARPKRSAWVEAQGPFGTAPGTAHFLDRQDQRWELEVQAQGGPATLVLSRLYYEGLWQATVDGKRVPLWPANACFTALPVPMGTHRVLLTPAQGPLRLRQALFLLGLFLALALLWIGRPARAHLPALETA